MTFKQFKAIVDMCIADNRYVNIITKSSRSYHADLYELNGYEETDDYIGFWHRDEQYRVVTWVCIGVDSIESLNFPDAENAKYQDQ